MGPADLARAKIRAQANGGDIPVPGDIIYINFDFTSKGDVYGLVLSWEEAPKKMAEMMPGPSLKMRVKAFNLQTLQPEYFIFTCQIYKQVRYYKMIEDGV